MNEQSNTGGLGRTTRAMATAPKGAAYIGPNRAWVRIEGRRLAASVARPDLVLLGAEELTRAPVECAAGRVFGGVVIDHATSIGRPHQAGLDYLRANVRPSGGAGIAEDGSEAA